MRRLLLILTSLAVVVGGGTAVAVGAPPAAAAPWTGLRAGVAVVDATWHIGAGAGQYASTEDEELAGGPKQAEWDPNYQHTKMTSSYGVASRLTMRAIVLQSPGGQPVALVKDDNYLAQDMLVRRVGQLLTKHGSKVTTDNILLSATHDHNSPYYSSPAAGVWVFQDVMDLRMFEYQARQMARAIEQAEAGLRPARMAATTVDYPDFQGNIAGNGVNEDGSPVGYPNGENDHGLVIMRFDDMTNPAQPTPLATWINYAQHGESLDGYDLISADWLGPFERYVDRATGVPTVFSQGSVGSSEGPYERGQKDTVSDNGDRVPRMWAHTGFAQAERGTHLLAERALAAWAALGGANNGVPVQVPYTTNAPVRMITHWVAGPLSHPYPSVGNCRSGPTANGDVGAPAAGLPDCQRSSDKPTNFTLPVSDDLYQQLRAEGAPIPSNYDVPSFGTVEENLRLKLQAVRIGDVLLASCACEAQSDLIKALESRTDQAQGNKWNGFDFANQAHVDDAWRGLGVAACHPVGDGSTYDCPNPGDATGQARLSVPADAFRHMQAEINNPADGWDAPAYVAQANSEPTDDAAIKGNFTGTELSAQCGYAVSVGLGHTGDYNGYTVSYREYMARDAYRKALTSYGAHTADYMVTRLMSVAANLRCGTPIPAEPTDALAAADEVRQQAEAAVLGRVAMAYYEGWTAQIPDSAGPARALTQPKDIQRFDGANFSWVGGDNWTDNPFVVVQRLVNDSWQRYADQTGEVPVVLNQPPAAWSQLAEYRKGAQQWTWTAGFEAFDAYPRADVPGGQVPAGTYRFLVNGEIKKSGAITPYHLTSRAFTVSPWTDLGIRDVQTSPDGSVSFAASVSYPRTYTSPIRFVHDDGGGLPDSGSVLCRTCTFRPWASVGTITSATVSVVDGSGNVRRSVDASLQGGRWVAATSLAAGESAVVAPGALHDAYGETNGTAVHL